MSEVLWTELEKIDVLRERMGLTYEQAREALNFAGGDVIKALANLEKSKTHLGDELKHKGSDILHSVKENMEKLGQTQINFKRHNKTVFSISAPLGVAVAYTMWQRPGLRLLGLIGAASAALKNYEVEFDTVAGHNPIYKNNPSGTAVDGDFELGI
ncbi:MAG: DUF4342 domain-containing protein [Desulfitobacterium hafniense]|nr:DUF4342 domain-containing protein [Desulfitobacterium hafniense]